MNYARYHLHSLFVLQVYQTTSHHNTTSNQNQALVSKRVLALKFSSWGDRISTHCMVLSHGICEYSVFVGNICYAAGTKTNSVLIMPPSRSCGWTMRHTPTCVKTRLPPHYTNDCCVLEPACPKMHFGFALNNMLPWSERTAKLNKLMTHLFLYYSSSLHHATHDRHSTNSKHVQCV